MEDNGNHVKFTLHVAQIFKLHMFANQFSENGQLWKFNSEKTYEVPVFSDIFVHSTTFFSSEEN